MSKYETDNDFKWLDLKKEPLFEIQQEFQTLFPAPIIIPVKNASMGSSLLGCYLFNDKFIFLSRYEQGIQIYSNLNIEAMQLYNFCHYYYKNKYQLGLDSQLLPDLEKICISQPSATPYNRPLTLWFSAPLVLQAFIKFVQNTKGTGHLIKNLAWDLNHSLLDSDYLPAWKYIEFCYKNLYKYRSTQYPIDPNWKNSVR